MKERYLSALAAVMYSVAALALICLIGSDFIFLSVTHSIKLISTFLVFICGFSGSYFLLLNAKTAEQKQKITFFSTLLLFIVYIIIILDFTLIDDSFGRNISNYFSLNYSQKAKFLEQNTNFIPFKTVKIFINGYNSGKLSLLAICENLIGNLIVFMPYAYFLPRLFHTTKKTVPFLVAVLLSVMVIEILQILFLTGSADIDDLILNTAGAMGIFGLMKTKGYYK